MAVTADSVGGARAATFVYVSNAADGEIRTYRMLGSGELQPGAPPPRSTDDDIWAADIHLTPDGKFLYVSERTSSTLGAFRVEGATGDLTYLASTPTERRACAARQVSERERRQLGRNRQL